MKASELRAKSQQELTIALDELLKERFNLRMQRGTGELTKPSRMNEVRKDIARVKTLMNERKSGNAS
ncbi:MAG: 50S ribosomal protein L29 [Candidatus Thiodiazotropha sp. (ex Lucinoma aequizonata)]|nr:50S ribosomal protein L29 [Candidatus Thiodiazotropha sp. (ex Lucinoma aequizonata)]MCU7887636.1 50S ribosomal protein L29 [Candidatus Thiodiazotropha sp. (ex Lucinoma aequizonata)]MCU7895004.1 50S ribosomal protein L29 [Candidatus Thiodiazotropha sp. (ex Lucinoma aequizonata)]MCU7897365.1 50S ribosomal protein L29 [Candidatus Thiodiazotropha sp. (ex Lucinoma aequizonata)]MCU7902893.1 50S ribosomal protein L29 [Candidatus Thiodiazotropha sp. (ex Lucinoma aequizonata)]